MQARNTRAVIFALALMAGFLLLAPCATAQQQSGAPAISEPLRVSPAEAYQKVQAGTALLVCAYPDDETFKKMQLEGAISLKEFESRLPGLTSNQEIIFY